MRLITDFIFLAIFFVLVTIWIVAWAAMHIVSGSIHLLLGLAVVFLVIHLVRGRNTA